MTRSTHHGIRNHRCPPICLFGTVVKLQILLILSHVEFHFRKMTHNVIYHMICKCPTEKVELPNRRFNRCKGFSFKHKGDAFVSPKRIHVQFRVAFQLCPVIQVQGELPEVGAAAFRIHFMHCIRVIVNPIHDGMRSRVMCYKPINHPQRQGGKTFDNFI